MRKIERHFTSGCRAALIVAAVVMCGVTNACAGQTSRSDDGYKVGEAARVTPDRQADRAPSTVRLARFEYVSGKVTWRPDSSAEWSAAKNSLPLRQGAEIWAAEGARAEIRFSDGSLLRVGNGVVTLKSLYSDEQGEYTEVRVLSGLVTVRPKQENSVFEFTTPTVTVKTMGPAARVRIGVTDVMEVGVRKGRAVVEGSLGKTALISGEFLSVRNSDKEYVHRSLPQPDSWERWNDERDRLLIAGRPAGARPGYYPASVWFSLDIPVYPDHRHFREGRHRW